jgi:hypothetical protein
MLSLAGAFSIVATLSTVAVDMVVFRVRGRSWADSKVGSSTGIGAVRDTGVRGTKRSQPREAVRGSGNDSLQQYHFYCEVLFCVVYRIVLKSHFFLSLSVYTSN